MSADAVAAVLAELRRDEAFLIDLAQQLVRIPTVNPKLQTGGGLNHEADLQYYLRAVLDGFGMHTETNEVFAGRPNLVGILPGAASRSLVLSAHVDVAPVGDSASWSVPPFGAELAQGKLFGRGALGMKSGLAAAVAVARAVRRARVDLGGQLELHAVVDGEAGGAGARDLVRRGRRASAMVMPYPTGQTVGTAHGGREWVRVTLRGRPATVQPEPLPAVSALDLAVQLVAGAVQPATGARAAAMQCGSGLGPNGLPAVLTDPGRIADVAAVDFEIALAPRDIPADIRAGFEAFVRDFADRDPWLREHPPYLRWELHGHSLPPLATPPEHELARLLRQAAGRNADTPPLVAASAAGYYAAAGIPSVLFGPAGHGMGAADEHVAVASLLAVAETLATVAVQWCGAR